MKLSTLLLPALTTISTLTAQGIGQPPADLAPGAPYRLMFVTDTGGTATSGNIEDYDAFVSADANAVPELAALATTWRVLASTGSVDARDHTMTDPTPSGPTGVPIYRVDGARIADHYDQLWSNSATPLHVLCTTTASGGTYSGLIFSGSFADGTVRPPYALGDTFVAIGNTGIADRWFASGNGANALSIRRFYAMSDVLTVPMPTQAEVSSYGQGCVGTQMETAPLRLESDLPVVGTSATLTVIDLPMGSTLGVLMAGLQSYDPGLDLTALGAPGCALYTSGDLVSIGFSVDGFVAATDLPIPAEASDVQLFWTAAVVAPPVNPLGLLTSNGIEWRTGVQ